MSTGIEWTDETWNPVTGCTKVSPGCDHCYAERITERFHGYGSFSHVVLHADRLAAPLHWRRPRRVFVNSMSDLFNVDVPREFIRDVFNVMRTCTGMTVAATGRRTPTHTFQVLTKRAERMERLARSRALGYDPIAPPANVWLGVSVESPTYYSRIRHLQRTPAALRFLSCEPLLAALPDLPLAGISWVIVGGESGPLARPMHPDWVRGIRDQCLAAGAPFFFKQWGEWEPVTRVYADDGHQAHKEAMWDLVDHDLRGRRVCWLTRDGYADETESFQPTGAAPWWMVRSGKRSAGRELDGREWNEYPGGPGRDGRGL